MIVTESAGDVFLTVTSKVAFPPGSGSEVGVADFVTRIELGDVRDRDDRVVVARDRVAVVVGARGGDDVVVLAARVAETRHR